MSLKDDADSVNLKLTVPFSPLFYCAVSLISMFLIANKNVKWLLIDSTNSSGVTVCVTRRL